MIKSVFVLFQNGNCAIFIKNCAKKICVQNRKKIENLNWKKWKNSCSMLIWFFFLVQESLESRIIFSKEHLRVCVCLYVPFPVCWCLWCMGGRGSKLIIKWCSKRILRFGPLGLVWSGCGNVSCRIAVDCRGLVISSSSCSSRYSSSSSLTWILCSLVGDDDEHEEKMKKNKNVSRRHFWGPRNRGVKGEYWNEWRFN